MNFFEFEGHTVSRVFKGNWQLAGGHGSIAREQAIADLFTYVEHGVNVFDVGDIYTGAEEILGEFLRAYTQKYGSEMASKLRVHTKFVPDLDALDDLTKDDIRSVIERSLKRLGLERLHLVQFHWWDFTKGDFVQAGQYLAELQKEGLIESIGLTNFDTAHTKKLVDAGVPIVSNQIQYSLLDPRPLNGMLEYARHNGIAIFCYGVLAGGLLGNARPGDEPENRSHIKYELMVKEVGMKYYQTLLERLADLATKYGTTVANIAAAYVLQTPGVSSAILGPRNTKHIEELDQLVSLKLELGDYARLHDLHMSLLDSNKDDVYSYERDITGPHGKIMKYNLNGMGSSN